MAGKDEFKFDDDDAFPETDLSGAFSEGEQSLPEEPEEPEHPEYPMTIQKTGGSRTRLLLLLLLLVVAAGGGAYYFLAMEEPVPPPPQKVVATAPKPAPPATAPAAPATVSVAPPPKPAATSPASPAAASPGAASPAPKQEARPVPAAAAVAPAPPAAGKPAPASPVATMPAPKPEARPVPATAVVAPAQPAASKPALGTVPGGSWQVEAGTYLNPGALKAAVAKIRTLGYEPRVSTAQKNIHMTRLRIGTVDEAQVKETLALARPVAPGAFALRAGDRFAVYAGTFANPQNLSQMSELLSGRGFKVEAEPIEVSRTISLLRFGGFADQPAADEAANRARNVGIAAVAVKTR